MTEQQINQRIARACGWKSKEETGGVPWLWVRTKPDYTCESTMEPLNYCRDLKAMYEAENTCINTAELKEEYYALINRNFRATARQRAEAFLRTLGKWEATIQSS
jgi:hypothetical protein